MYLVAIAWIYVALMMAVAEATNTNGTVLGGVVTFIFYGLLPTALVMYLMGTPMRRRAAKARERTEWEVMQANQALAGADNARTATENIATTESNSVQPDAGRHAPGAAQAGSVAPVRKEL